MYAPKFSNQDGITTEIIRMPIIKNVSNSPVASWSTIFRKIYRPIKNKPQANNRKRQILNFLRRRDCN